jgi:hypothetical protein
MASKAEEINWFLKRRVRDAVNDLIADSLDDSSTAKVLKNVRESLVNRVQDRCTGTYDVIELNDIMHWKEPKKV